jgi:uncharacterized protein YneF (UPF0154 family)
MSTALIVITTTCLLPVFTLIGVFVGHKITIKSQNPNEQNNRSL